MEKIEKWIINGKEETVKILDKKESKQIIKELKAKAKAQKETLSYFYKLADEEIKRREKKIKERN